MTIELITKGGSGLFVAGSVVSNNISIGSSGDLLIVPGTQGSRIKLSYLITQTADETGITVTCGSRDVISSLSLATITSNANASTNAFCIASSTGADGFSNISEIITRPGESLTINKDSGNTSNIIYYTYQIEA